MEQPGSVGKGISNAASPATGTGARGIKLIGGRCTFNIVVGLPVKHVR